MNLDKQKYDEHIDINVRPILEKHELINHKSKYAANQILSFINSDLNNYMGDRKKAVKEEVFGEILKFFGDFEFKKDHKLPFQYLHGSMIIPDYTGYSSEDRISGVFNNTKVDIAEIALVAPTGGGHICSFKGLVVILDFCNTDLVLRGPFNGKTALVADHKKHLEYLKNKFKDFEQIEPPVKDLESRFEVYTTNAKEANSMLTEDFLYSFINLSDYITSLEEQVTHADDKVELMYLQNRQNVKDRQLEARKLWWEQLVDEIREIKDAKLHSVYKEDPSNGLSELESLNNDIACSIYDDKILLTIPHSHDLFEPNPLSEDPIINEDIELIYHLMTAISKITDILIDSKSSS